MLVTREMMDAVYTALVEVNGPTPEAYQDLILARTTRYFMLMDHTTTDLNADEVYMIYYAFLIDTGEGPVELA